MWFRNELSSSAEVSLYFISKRARVRLSGAICTKHQKLTVTAEQRSVLVRTQELGRIPNATRMLRQYALGSNGAHYTLRCTQDYGLKLITD